MYYGIRPKSLRGTLEFDTLEGESADSLLLKGCTGVFANESDATWIVELAVADSVKGKVSPKLEKCDLFIKPRELEFDGDVIFDAELTGLFEEFIAVNGVPAAIEATLKLPTIDKLGLYEYLKEWWKSKDPSVGTGTLLFSTPFYGDTIALIPLDKPSFIVGDYVKGFEHYGNNVREMRGTIHKIYEDGSMYVQCDDCYSGERGNNLDPALGTIEKCEKVPMWWKK